ncbi:LysR family transcriptional regulator [Nocardiopsis sp. NPDC006139]|uniref:LysR family transcriptional regulator n=1 Tax=Nocardiopsis sp. NPDC006139 TaxID=3154578 RepID=UPI0033B5E599
MLERHGLYEVFLTVAETGSFTAAARVLGYTQSAVSRQVQALEQELGAVLFDRLPRGVALTGAGRALVPHARAAVGHLAAARAELAALRRLDGGRLRVGSFSSAGVTLVPRALAGLRRLHPGVEVTHVEALTADLVGRVEEGALDAAVVVAPAGPVRVELLPLLEEPLLVAVPAGHRLAGRAGVRLEELAGEAWIAGRERAGETLLGPAVERGFRPRIAHVVREWAAKQGFVAAGLGVTVLPALAAASLRPDVALAALAPGELPPRPVCVALPRGRARSAAAGVFGEQLGRAVALVPGVAADRGGPPRHLPSGARGGD